MKTWIIALAIVFVVLKLIQTGLKNYIKNDREESIKYYFSQGTSKLGIVHSFFWILTVLVGSVDAILLFIYIINSI